MVNKDREQKEADKALNELLKAAELADNEWRKLNKLYHKFIDKLIECRKNELFYPQHSDMWYLGYLMSVQMQGYEIDTIINAFREGLEEGREQIKLGNVIKEGHGR